MNKIAAIDIGTNSFHMVIVESLDNNYFNVIDREKEVLRLSPDSGKDMKRIREELIPTAIELLRRFADIAKSHGAEIHAVATSAVREATNQEEFIEIIKKETGISINVISGIEEARLIYLGVLKSIPAFNRRILCIDIGGGSTEFLIGEKEKILYSNSIKIGAVRLSNRFFTNYEFTKNTFDECAKWIEGEMYPVIRSIKEIGFDMVVGSSGTIMSTALIISALRNSLSVENLILNNYTFTKEELKRVVELVYSSPKIKQRLSINGLDPKRADIFPAGILILKTIFDNLKLKSLTVSGYSLREGLIINILRKKNTLNPEHVLDNIRFDSINKLADSCKYDKQHCRHVSNIAVKLFDLFSNIFNLPEHEKEYLEAASILHDIGYHISHSKHHKHSYYIIRNSELLGFNDNEIKIIANTARYHRKSHPKIEHP